MPRIDWAEYLVGFLFEFGPVGKDGPFEAGMIGDIEQVLKTRFKPWEGRLLLRLSREYQGEMHAAAKADRACPWPEVAWQWRRARAAQAERNLDAFCK